jgi:hypothetical protein
MKKKIIREEGERGCPRIYQDSILSAYFPRKT